MKIGIVISNYNGWRDTLACLQSLRRQTVQDFEIVLVDDASTNDSVRRLRRALPANAVFLPQRKNLGYAAANNIGIRRALADGAEWILLLNNDTVCAPDLLQNLLEQTPPRAVSCPKMLFADPPDEIWFAGGELNPKTWRVRHLGGHCKDSAAFSRRMRVGFVTFCCVLLPRQVVEQVGFLDERLFMYCEDAEYCARLRQAGVALWYLPDAVLRHRAGATAGGMLSQYYIVRNTLHLQSRTLPPALVWGRAAWQAVKYGLLCLGAHLLGHRHGRSYGRWRGAVDFLRGRTGKLETDRREQRCAG